MSHPYRDQRRQPEEFLGGLLSERDHDEIDELMVDPMLSERPPATRSKVDSDRLLALLDELARGGEE